MSEAESDKHRRYPAAQTPWRAVPLATETGGRLGDEALKLLRKLARNQAEKLEEGGDTRLIHTIRGRGYCLNNGVPFLKSS